MCVVLVMIDLFHKVELAVELSGSPGIDTKLHLYQHQSAAQAQENIIQRTHVKRSAIVSNVRSQKCSNMLHPSPAGH